MIKIPFFYLKDKQAFVRCNGALRLLGKPIEQCRRLNREGATLIHIIDTDAINGGCANFDIYDNLTYFVNIQVEAGNKPDFIKRLLQIKARVVVELPTKIGLDALQGYERLLVGRIKPDYNGDLSGVHDLLIENVNDSCITKFHKTGKRLIVYDSDYRKLETENQKLVWGMLFSLVR